MTQEPENGQLIYEALYFLECGPHRHALEVMLDKAVRYEKALQGIAACSTVGAEDCARVARMVLTHTNEGN